MRDVTSHPAAVSAPFPFGLILIKGNQDELAVSLVIDMKYMEIGHSI
jgi:hypothetical protein